MNRDPRCQIRVHAIKGFAQFSRALPTQAAKIADVVCQLLAAGTALAQPACASGPVRTRTDGCPLHSRTCACTGEDAEVEAVQRVIEVLVEVDLAGTATAHHAFVFSPVRVADASPRPFPPVLGAMPATLTVITQQLATTTDELLQERTFGALAQQLAKAADKFNKDATLVELLLTELQTKVCDLPQRQGEGVVDANDRPRPRAGCCCRRSWRWPCPAAGCMS